MENSMLETEENSNVFAFPEPEHRDNDALARLIKMDESYLEATTDQLYKDGVIHDLVKAYSLDATLASIMFQQLLDKLADRMANKLNGIIPESDYEKNTDVIKQNALDEDALQEISFSFSEYTGL